MTLPPRRFDYAPINDRPIIKWPNNARVAFWVAPNMEFFEYLPENRPTQPDIPFYSRMDYGNRVGFWRMLDVCRSGGGIGQKGGPLGPPRAGTKSRLISKCGCLVRDQRQQRCRNGSSGVVRNQENRSSIGDPLCFMAGCPARYTA